MIAGNETIEHYSMPARLFHWLTVMLIVGQFAIAWTMPHVGRASVSIGLIGWHLTLGLAIGVTTTARVGWRLISPPPPAPSSLPVALAKLSRAMHWLLYSLLIILPLLGWINSNARGWSLNLLGAVPLAQLVAEGSPFGRAMGDVHSTIAIVFLVVVGLHVAGACYHAFVLKDGTMRRMA
jgi:cytochrome b561